MTITDPAQWEDLFTRTVDEHPVQFVRPADTDRPTWAIYEGSQYLGTVSAELEGGRPRWRVQTSGEAHHDLDDAVRALRRPATWPRERAQVSHWARRLLAEDNLLAVDVETTGLQDAYAVQIAAVDRRGVVVFNEYVQPDAIIEPEAIAVHGITPERVATAPTFADLLPRLTEVFHGRTAVAYKVDFDRGVFERELVRRRRGDATAANEWLARCRGGGGTRWCRTPYGADCGRSSAAPTATSRSAARTTRSPTTSCCLRNSNRWPGACPPPAGDLPRRQVLCASKIKNGPPGARRSRIRSQNPFSLKSGTDPLLRLALCENPGP